MRRLDGHLVRNTHGEVKRRRPLGIRNPLYFSSKNFGTISVNGSPDPSHFIFEINVGKRRIRYGTTLNLNDLMFIRFSIDLEIHYKKK